MLITGGKDKGQKGMVERLFPLRGRVLVQGLNVYKKSRRGLGGQPGGMIEFSRPLPVANVALICPKCGKPTRIGNLSDKRGEKLRVCRKCKAVVETKKEEK